MATEFNRRSLEALIDCSCPMETQIERPDHCCDDSCYPLRALEKLLPVLDATTAIYAHDEAESPNWGETHHKLVVELDDAVKAAVDAGLGR